MMHQPDFFESCSWAANEIATLDWPKHGVFITLGLAPTNGVSSISGFNRAHQENVSKLMRLVKDVYHETVFTKRSYRRGEEWSPCIIVPEQRSKETGAIIPVHIHAVFTDRRKHVITKFMNHQQEFIRSIKKPWCWRPEGQAVFPGLSIDIKRIEPGEIEQTVQYCAKYSYDVIDQVHGKMPDGKVYA